MKQLERRTVTQNDITRNSKCPNRKSGPCMPVAIAIAEHWDYDDVHDLLMEHWHGGWKRSDCCCQGTLDTTSMSLLKALGYEFTHFERAESFERQQWWGTAVVAGRYPSVSKVVPRTGTHIVYGNDHAFVVIDGVIHDSRTTSRATAHAIATKPV